MIRFALFQITPMNQLQSPVANFAYFYKEKSPNLINPIPSKRMNPPNAFHPKVFLGRPHYDHQESTGSGISAESDAHFFNPVDSWAGATQSGKEYRRDNT